MLLRRLRTRLRLILRIKSLDLVIELFALSFQPDLAAALVAVPEHDQKDYRVLESVSTARGEGTGTWSLSYLLNKCKRPQHIEAQESRKPRAEEGHDRPHQTRNRAGLADQIFQRRRLLEE